MKYIYITSDLTPNYDLQDQIYDTPADNLSSIISDIVCKILMEYTGVLKKIMGETCEVHWLITKNQTIEKISLPDTQTHIDEWKKIVQTNLQDAVLTNNSFDDGGIIKLAFSSPTTNIWDYEMIEVSRMVGPTALKSFYLFILINLLFSLKQQVKLQMKLHSIVTAIQVVLDLFRVQ